MGVVQRDNTILQLAVEDPHATLPYNPKQWTFSVSGADTALVLGQEEGYSVSLTSEREANNGSYVTIGQTAAEIWRFSIFQDGGRRPLGFSKFQNFNGRTAQEG